MHVDKWDYRFIRVAREVSTWSKDPGSKIGVVAVRDKRILATGYNGLPSRMDDDGRLNDREWKLRNTVHGEMNCLINAAKNGVRLDGASLYVYGLPVCDRCAPHVAQAGIARVFECFETTKPEWEASSKHSRLLFTEVGIEYMRIGTQAGTGPE